MSRNWWLCNLRLITGKQGQCCSHPWITVSQIQASAGAALYKAGKWTDTGLKWPLGGNLMVELEKDWVTFPMQICFWVLFVAPLLLLIRPFLLSVSPALQKFTILIPGTWSKMQPINCWATPGQDQFAQGYSWQLVLRDWLIMSEISGLTEDWRLLQTEQCMSPDSDRGFTGGMLERFQHAQVKVKRNQLIRHSWSTEV